MINFLTGRLTFILTALFVIVIAFFLLVANINHLNKQIARDKLLIENLEQYKSQVLYVSQEAKATLERLDELTKEHKILMREYHELAKNKPLPNTCLIDNDRLQFINKAIQPSTTR
ncbi:hypothetical protein [Taylorella equigenitalis]|uniref:hypothetical protein n=1 Tax=Taylorella equigenitalis TaxID=29575 RepID=UPI0003FA3325|nr:hypothetical protein [Taylorella equigenitalis]ASY30180.1 hypothetical protein B9Z30_02080 [Taylorella equigenitalis]KOS58497.1 hypothetical protein AM589_06395 [Taylorella equigenitalis]